MRCCEGATTLSIIVNKMWHSEWWQSIVMLNVVMLNVSQITPLCCVPLCWMSLCWVLWRHCKYGPSRTPKLLYLNSAFIKLSGSFDVLDGIVQRLQEVDARFRRIIVARMNRIRIRLQFDFFGAFVGRVWNIWFNYFISFPFLDLNPKT